VRTAINTGTIAFPAHIIISSINEITGVERIATRSGLRKTKIPWLIPAGIPKRKASARDIKNPKSPLYTVLKTEGKKSSLVTISITDNKVRSGEGTI